jgi:uncharacterized membrane protein YagU involved in acid resistance
MTEILVFEVGKTILSQAWLFIKIYKATLYGASIHVVIIHKTKQIHGVIEIIETFLSAIGMGIVMHYVVTLYYGLKELPVLESVLYPAMFLGALGGLPAYYWGRNVFRKYLEKKLGVSDET